MNDYDENNDIKEEEFQGDESQENELSELEKLRQENQQNLEGWQRARADYANLQKQSLEEKSRLRQFIIGNFVRDLFPVLDSFEMAMKNKQVWEAVDENWRKGIEYIVQQFHKTLEDYGISKIEVSEGNAFDPNLHEPMETVATDDESKENCIAEIIQNGYKMGEEVLRPVKVKIYIINNKS